MNQTTYCHHRASRSVRRALWALPLLILGTAAPAAADTITFEFTGVVTKLVSNTGVFGMPGNVQVGDSFSGRFSYEIGPGNADQFPSPTGGLYDASTFVIDDAVVPISVMGIGVKHEPGIPTIFPEPPNLGEDSFRIVSAAPNDVPVVLKLEGPFGTVFTDDSLPENLLLADFPSNGVRAIVALGFNGGQDILDAGQLRTLTRTTVPEPSTAALLVAGLVAGVLALARESRSRHIRNTA